MLKLDSLDKSGYIALCSKCYFHVSPGNSCKNLSTTVNVDVENHRAALNFGDSDLSSPNTLPASQFQGMTESSQWIEQD